MIIKCSECGAMNRIPDLQEPGRLYRCGKCHAKIIVESKSDDGHESNSPADSLGPVDLPQHDRIGSILSKVPFLDPLLSWFKGNDYRIVFLIALLALFLHLLIIPYASMPIYDEIDYVEEAKSIILEGKLLHPEQLSLAKLFITSGIWILGDNPWGWRVASAIFAFASIILFYFVCRKLAGKTTAFFSFFLLTFESFIFSYSSLAMVEVFVMTFMLMSFLFFLKDRYILSGISLALSGLCKMTGLLGVLVILGYWLIKKRAKSPKNMGLLIVSAVAAFMLLMPLLDFAATREWLNPIDRLSFVIQFHESKTWTSLQGNFTSMEAPPWEWVLYPIAILWPYYNFLSQISLTVWIMIVPSMGYMVYQFIRKRTDFSLFILLWFAVTYFFWTVLTIAIDRVTYHYYFYPSLWAVCAAIGFALSEFWRKASERRFSKDSWGFRIAVIGFLGLHVLFFLLTTMVVPALKYYLH